VWGRAAVGCSVSGVGEAIIRAGLAKGAATAAANTGTDLDTACSAAIGEGILQARVGCCRYESSFIGGGWQDCICCICNC
jgi:isoaspartyl peptidase/L-asparaginase-like protein (Ntn-hydrolase superfamily)